MERPIRADLHCHTTASYDGKVEPGRLVEQAVRRGLTHIAITDHETIAGAVAARDAAPAGLTVIVGEEVRTADGDLILLFVEEAIPRGLTIDETVRLAHDQGCLVGLAHPFDSFRPSVGVGKRSQADLQSLAQAADYVEIHNGRVRDDHHNARAAELARQFALPGAVVSDCHKQSEIGQAYLQMAGAFATADEFRELLDHALGRVRDTQGLSSAAQRGRRGGILRPLHRR